MVKTPALLLIHDKRIHFVIVINIRLKYLKNTHSLSTLTYQIVVAHQIRVALGTFSEINNSSPSNNHNLGKKFKKKQK